MNKLRPFIEDRRNSLLIPILFLGFVSVGSQGLADDFRQQPSGCSSLLSGVIVIEDDDERARMITGCFEASLSICAANDGFLACMNDQNLAVSNLLKGTEAKLRPSIVEGLSPGRDLLFNEYVARFEDASEGLDSPHDVDIVLASYRTFLEATISLLALQDSLN